MAPKKTYAARRAKKVFTPTRANPRISEVTQDGATDEDEEFNSPLNQDGPNPMLDMKKYLPPSRKGNRVA